MDDHLGPSRPGKRQRLDSSALNTTINSAADLRRLLTSHQGAPSGLKSALQQFKDFLTVITRSADDAARTVKLQVLKEYSEEQIPLSQQTSIFPDLLLPWFSATEANNQTILSLIPSVLALYLKAISSRLEFREIGLSLGRYLLLKDQLQLLDRGLTATKTKEHLISPCLRLLTEVVSFDGGELAHLVYLKRETTLCRLEVFLDQRTPSSEEGQDTGQRPTLRRIAQRYLLANLKFQSANAKGAIIADGKALKACLQNLRNDKADIVCDVLSSLDKDIVQARSLARHSKCRLFSSSNLSLLASLYGPHNGANELFPRNPRSLVDGLLRQVCTQQDSGVLSSENGWYPAGSSPDLALPTATDSSNITLASGWASQLDYRNKTPVKNAGLSTFIQGLRPDVDKLQATLLLDIFRAAPELVADYFSRKRDLITEPKDTPSWLGQSAFLFSVIQLPVPECYGWKGGHPTSPPPSPTVIESILPRPLGQTSMTRSLNLNHEVITLFAVRALTVAFQKLERVVVTYPESWRQASSDLVLAFSQRIPSPRDILSTLHRTPRSDEQLRGAITELLAKYHQALPHLMLTEKFDVSLALVDNIRRIEEDTADETLESSRFAELENLLQIANSSDTKWWQKPDSLHYSLFTSAIHAVSTINESSHLSTAIQGILRKIVVDQGVLPSEWGYFSALMSSLRAQGGRIPSAKVISFLDNCASRVARQPVYYQDSADALGIEVAGTCLLQVCIAEQWQFATKQDGLEDQKDIAQWITRLSILFIQNGLGRNSAERLYLQVLNTIGDAALEKSIQRQYLEGLNTADSQAQHKQGAGSNSPTKHASGHEGDHIPSRLEEMFPRQQKKSEWTEAFEHVHQQHVGGIVEDGRLSRLCMSLSSQSEEIRRKAFVTLQALTKRIELSDYSEKRPLFVMIAELVESTSAFGIARPLPSVLTEFAAGAVKILSQPSHAMYSKVNQYLQKGPRWGVSKFVRHWLGNILLLEPEEDNGHVQERSWLLNLLVQGLAADEDLELYRKGNVFELVLALYMSRLCTESQRRQILELVYRAINLGGSMTLVTRMGLESWFTLAQAEGGNAKVIQELKDRLVDSSDGLAIQQWKVPAATG